MRRVASILFASFVLVAASGTGIGQAATGCAVTATGYPGSAGSCRYIASGPGTYKVRSLSGFRIMASADEGVSWRTVAAKVGIPNQPASGLAFQEGTIATAAGELVDVAVGITWHDTPQGTIRYQDGTLEAADA
jgi:hypothetical protein